ncbi:MAG TPA: DUF1593 domain-containing protein [Draconibacterium sp.]|nr:DUF1593 domain-containing protein [Draconibacterium sp.]
MKTIFLFLIFFIPELVIYASEKPAVVVLTDIGGDTDDQQSLVRFLLYSDMFDVKAICATSRLGHGHDTRPDLIIQQIKAYKQVYPNLLHHSKGYPLPDYLLSVVKSGLGDPSVFGENKNSEASDYIIKVIDESKDIVHIVIWGGQRELVQALWKIQESRSKDAVSAFCKKIQVHAIGDQDKHRDWILNNFKDIQYIADGFVFTGNFGIREISALRGMYMTGDHSMQNGKWVEKNVHNHGALSNCYPLNGAGTDGLKEGDSPSFLGLICNGLNFPDKPEWGGWGGRYRLLKKNLFIDAQDFLDGTLNERHTVARWRPAFQRDFMSRLDWCVKSYKEANHNPFVKVNNSDGKMPLFVNSNNGSSLVFDASDCADPDKNDLSFHWFFYNEIGFAECSKLVTSKGGQICTVTIPESLHNRTIHLILEVTDNGTPSLTTYKRIVIQIT